MSADNTVAVLEMRDGCRVAHVQAIENINYKPDYPDDNPVFNREWLIAYFGNSQVTPKYKALDDAFALEKKIGYVEYGVRILEYKGIDFPAFPAECLDK